MGHNLEGKYFGANAARSILWSLKRFRWLGIETNDSKLAFIWKHQLNPDQ